MTQDQYTPHNYRQEFIDQKERTEMLADFLEFLFDHSGYIKGVLYNDALKEFKEWRTKQG